MAELSKRLGVTIATDMFVQSHTPFESLVQHIGKNSNRELKNEHILVVGGEGDNCRHVAESYGLLPSRYQRLPT